MLAQETDTKGFFDPCPAGRPRSARAAPGSPRASLYKYINIYININK